MITKLREALIQSIENPTKNLDIKIYQAMLAGILDKLNKVTDEHIGKLQSELDELKSKVLAVKQGTLPTPKFEDVDKITIYGKDIKTLAELKPPDNRVKYGPTVCEDCGETYTLSSHICNPTYKQLQSELDELKNNGYVRHKHSCRMGEYNSILIGKGCTCGLSKTLQEKGGE